MHAAATTQQSPNSEQGTLKLNHKTRIYNKWGQKVYSYRGGRGLFKYGSTVKYRGKVKAITDPRTKRYAFRDDDWNWFYLPYRTIRGQEYYNIGHGGYVKAANVSKVDGCYLYTNEVTFRANAKYPILRAVNGKPKSTGKAINKGQTVTLNGRTSEYPLYGYYEDGDGDSSDFLIKGSNKEYISLDNDTFRQILL
ncbi:hypothetical protein EQ500_11360, partial [Lactobacillus sp. XV13L]|nr:hypothetical protein [Lactobacillus sp. XV13L]